MISNKVVRQATKELLKYWEKTGFAGIGDKLKFMGIYCMPLGVKKVSYSNIPKAVLGFERVILSYGASATALGTKLDHLKSIDPEKYIRVGDDAEITLALILILEIFIEENRSLIERTKFFSEKTLQECDKYLATTYIRDPLEIPIEVKIATNKLYNNLTNDELNSIITYYMLIVTSNNLDKYSEAMKTLDELEDGDENQDDLKDLTKLK